MQEHDNFKEYIAQKGDTVQSIAIKFDLPVQWLRQINHLVSDIIIPGDRIKIWSKMEVSKYLKDIPTQMFDPKDQQKKPHGTLYLYPECLRFFSRDSNENIMIKLDDIVDLDVVISPFNNLDSNAIKNTNQLFYLLMVSYKKQGEEKISSSLFSGMRLHIQPFKKELALAINARRRKSGENANLLEVDSNIWTPNTSSEQSANTSREVSDHEDDEIHQKTTKKTEENANEGNKSSPPMHRFHSNVLLPIEIKGQTHILTSEDFLSLRNSLPFRFKNSNWLLLFQMSKDGCSYNTFFQFIHNCQPILLIIKTFKNEKIGTFSTEGFRSSDHYTGTGETSVFRLTPSFEYFTWSQNNKYFIACTNDSISVGGGGASAIWIDENFLNAYSESCPTFNSPCLTSTNKFQIQDIEAWQII